MTDVLVVAVEDLWPPRQGGQVRVAGLIEALRAQFDVAVAIPGARRTSSAPVPVYPLTGLVPRPRLRDFLSRKPRLGRALLGAQGVSRLVELVNELRPSVVLFTHSYLAAAVGPLSVPVIVDYANIEVQRLGTFASNGSLQNRVSARFEALKARFWEPRVSRSADLCLALSGQDLQTIRDWGGNVVCVPNAVAPGIHAESSPEAGVVLFLASADYAPNRKAAEWFVQAVWPRVSECAPQARLLLAGRGTDEAYVSLAKTRGVEVVGEVEDVVPLYRNAAVVVAPVTSGGGQQLKVIEALAHRRVLVATTFSARSVPSDLAVLCDIADDANEFAAAVAKALLDPCFRWDRERRGAAAVESVVTWGTAAEPAMSWIGEHL